MNPMK